MSNELFKNLPTPTNASETTEEIPVTETEELTEAGKAAQNIVEDDNDDDELIVDELTLLKAQAKTMGINPGNMGLDALKKKIKAKLDGEESSEDASEAKPGDAAEEKTTTDVVKPTTKAKTQSLRQKYKLEQMKLVRVRISNMDPKDANLSGQIYTVANEFLGTVTKFVPFGEASENGYHIPYCLYQFLKGMMFTQIRVTRKNGQMNVETKDVRKFSLEVLPPLTSAELNRLKASQLASGAVDK